MGIAGLVQRIDGGQDGTIARVNDVGLRTVPARVAQAHLAQVGEGLRDDVHQTLGVLVGVPLQVTDQARVVIDYAKPDGRDPFALAVEDLQRALVAIEVKQCAHVRGLEAAHLAGAIGYGGAPRSTSRLALRAIDSPASVSTSPQLQQWPTKARELLGVQ